MKKYKKYLLIGLLYLIFAVIFTWPLVTQINTHGFGFDEDSPYHIWHNWWLKFSLFTLHQNPLSTNYIFFPQRIPLIYDANSFVFAALTLPFQMVVSVLTASNIVFLVSFALSAFTMFALAKYFTKDTLISFLAGVVFAFTPYTLAQATDGHTNLITTWIIPLYTLFLLITLDKTLNNYVKRQTFYLCVLTGILASLQLYNDFTYTTFLVIETGLIIFYKFTENYLNNKSLVNIFKSTFIIGSLAGFTALILTSPLLLEVSRMSKTGFKPGSPLWVQNEWAADLAAYFRPPDRSTFLKPISYTPPRGSVEGTVFFGYSVLLILATFKIIYLFKRNKLSASTARQGGLWLFLTLSFFLLSLGPTLHVNGRIQFDVLGFKNIIFPLPWTLLHFVPFIGETQEPARLNPFLILGVAMSVAIFLKELRDRVPPQKITLTRAAVVVVITLVSFEYLQIPFPTTDLRPSEIYKQVAADKTNFSVLVLPLGFNSGNLALGKSPIGSLQYFQVIHEHPSFRGTVARLPLWAFEYYKNLPLIKFFIDPSKSPDVYDLDSKKVQEMFKNELQIKYVVVHKNKYEAESYKKTEELLETVAGAKKLFNSQDVDGYKLE